MKTTRLSKSLGIQHPIIQAGMSWVSNAELAAAVSNAGGLGVIVPNAGLAANGDIAENYYAQLRKLRALTTKPYGVSLNLGHLQLDTLVNITIEQSVPVVFTALGSPDVHTGLIKDAGITVFHVASSVSEARAAEARGADVIVAQGHEAGNQVGRNELPTFALVPQVVDAVEIPVVAAGGIVDGRGLAAALSLGATAAQMGTRFLATYECIAHHNIKEAIINAIDSSTTIINVDSQQRRVLKNATSGTFQEANGSKQELSLYLIEDLERTALLDGKLEEGLALCGAGAGLITELLSTEDLMKATISQADSIITRIK